MKCEHDCSNLPQIECNQKFNLGIHGPKPIGLGPISLVFSFEQTRTDKTMRNLRPTGTMNRTNKILKISDRSGPGLCGPWIPVWFFETGVLTLVSETLRYPGSFWNSQIRSVTNRDKDPIRIQLIFILTPAERDGKNHRWLWNNCWMMHHGGVLS